MHAFRPHRFWINWLLVASGCVALFGMILVVAPAVARQGFSLLVYSSGTTIDAFGRESARYVSMSHAVIGGVMVGWGMAMFYATLHLVSNGSRVGWNLIALSVVAWFVPDTAYSLIAGFWQNAVLNVVFLCLFVPPMWAVRGSLQEEF